MANFLGHPKALSTLFFTELWERFSYYGMRAILILFMVSPSEVGGLNFPIAKAAIIYAIYTGSVYLACLPGGWLADYFFGLRRTTFFGGIIIMAGHICLALFSGFGFFLGLFLIAIGTGLLKPNISALVGTLYRDNQDKRDSGYSIYYMGINIGAFSAPLLCGWLAQSEGFRSALSTYNINPANSWHFAFAAAAVGMGIGLIAYVRGSRLLKTYEEQSVLTETARQMAFQKLISYGFSGLILLSFILFLFQSKVLELSTETIGNGFGLLLLFITATFFFKIFSEKNWTPKERKNLYLITILFLGATVFWSLFEQAGSTLNIFAEKNTNNQVSDFVFPSSWFQSLNPIYIICLAPIFAFFWSRLGEGKISNIGKFAIGLLFMAFGWGIMIFAALEAQKGILVSPAWLAAMYFLHAIGEMFVSPVGLSAISRLAPAKITGLTMGIWFLASSIGSYAGGRVAGFYDTFSIADIFSILTIIAVIASCLLGFTTTKYTRSK